MSLPVVGCFEVTDGFPRVSGDEPWIAKTERIIAAFSPRERG